MAKNCLFEEEKKLVHTKSCSVSKVCLLLIDVYTVQYCSRKLLSAPSCSAGPPKFLRVLNRTPNFLSFPSSGENDLLYNIHTIVHPFPALAKTLCYTIYNCSSFPTSGENALLYNIQLCILSQLWQKRFIINIPLFILSQIWRKRFVIQYTIFHPIPALGKTLCYAIYNCSNVHPFPALAKTLCYTIYNFSSFPSSGGNALLYVQYV